MAAFTVKYKDLGKNTEHEMNVDGNDITTQEEAEEHVRNLPKSRGGTHAGLDVIPKSGKSTTEVTQDKSE